MYIKIYIVYRTIGFNEFWVLIFVLEIMTSRWNLFVQILSVPLHILMAYQPDMGPVHSGVILTVWHLSLKLWPLKSICPNLVPASTQKLLMRTVSYFQSRTILQGTYALLGDLDLLTFSLENMTFTMKLLSGPLLGNCKWQCCASYFLWKSYGICLFVYLLHYLLVHVCPGHCSETIHNTCFIFSGQINLTWNL